MHAAKTVGGIVPHMRSRNGGLRYFFEIGNAFAEIGIEYTLFVPEICGHEWLTEARFPVRRWRDGIHADFLIMGEPRDIPDLRSVSGALFVWIIAGGEYLPFYHKLYESYPCFANNPGFLADFPRARFLQAGLPEVFRPAQPLRVGYHGLKADVVEEQLGGHPNVVLVKMLDMDDAALCACYNTLDWFASAEPRIGWSGMGAEALACGVPVVTMDDNCDGYLERVIKVSSLRRFFDDPMAEYRWAATCRKMWQFFNEA